MALVVLWVFGVGGWLLLCALGVWALGPWDEDEYIH